jgi:hypothetical protein
LNDDGAQRAPSNREAISASLSGSAENERGDQRLMISSSTAAEATRPPPSRPVAPDPAAAAGLLLSVAMVKQLLVTGG